MRMYSSRLFAITPPLDVMLTAEMYRLTRGPPHDGCLIAVGNIQKGTDAYCTLMEASFPIQPSIRGKYSIPHPYFTFLLPGKNNNKRIVQWQVRPKEDGLRRYTLVEIGSALEVSESALWEDNLQESKILAIYHHIGINVWLPKDLARVCFSFQTKQGRKITSGSY